MMLISAIIISQWSTKEQNKGHRFHISWSLCNPLFPFVWAWHAGLTQKTLQMNAGVWWFRLTHMPPVLCSRPKNFPDQKSPQCWSKPNPDPNPGKKQVSPHFIKWVIQWTSVLLKPHGLTSAIPRGCLRTLLLCKCKTWPLLRFPVFQQKEGRANKRPMKTSENKWKEKRLFFIVISCSHSRNNSRQNIHSLPLDTAAKIPNFTARIGFQNISKPAPTKLIDCPRILASDVICF